MQVGIIVIAVLIMCGVALTLMMMNDGVRDGVLDIGLDTKTAPIEFSGLKMVPGDSVEYDMSFTGRRAEAYNVNLSFTDADPDGTLKNFIRVKILSGQTVIYDELLVDAMNGDGINVNVTFKANENTELKLIYYMPLEVGNEAKLATSDFRLNITSTIED
jgi:uncharacterized membrane protein